MKSSPVKLAVSKGGSSSSSEQFESSPDLAPSDRQLRILMLFFFDN
jgi:hypothetical protein